MGKRLILFVLAAALCCSTAYAREEVYVKTIPDTQQLSVNAKAAVVIEAQTGRVLFAQNAQEQLRIASTTKIMTALIALEQPGLDRVFEVDADAIRVEGSSMGLEKGDKVTLRSLAAGMLLCSGNDAANATAVRIAGSIPAFAELMNQKARQLGLAQTSFENPSGLDSNNHYSTAYDMAMLARAALKNEEFAEICSQYKLRTCYGNPPYDRWLTNHNKLLNYYEGTIGVKTGFTKKAGRCLVSAARKNGVELICVTLGCPDDWNVHQNLYDRFFGELKIQDLSRELPPLHIPVTGGTQAAVAVAPYDKVEVAVPLEGASVEYGFRVEPFLYAPVREGQVIGEVSVYLDKQLIYTMPLTAGSEVPLLHEYDEKPGVFERVAEWWKGLLGDE